VGRVHQLLCCAFHQEHLDRITGKAETAKGKDDDVERGGGDSGG